MKRTTGERVFGAFNILIMLFIMAVIIVPMLHIIALSVSSAEAINYNRVTVYPIGFNFAAYKRIIGFSTFSTSLVNTVFITIIGTALAVIMTVLLAYAMSQDFPGKKIVTYFFVVSMYFSGGLIPTYIVFSKYLHLRNTYWVLFITGIVNVFYMIVVRSQIEAMPQSVFEAARIDGAGEFQTLFRITLPMISPTVAAISMFFALGYWNSWYNVMVYTDNQQFWTLQYFLRVVVLQKLINANDISIATQLQQGTAQESFIPEANFRMACVIIVAAPIVAIYPFVQKYFVKGIIAGSVKG
ncbi:MAG: carbohydrate ABC transporter permease [Clostridiaceae bacterium]|nr:carbohydrate ABC transporter permease [Clostridiaceae bacterium]